MLAPILKDKPKRKIRLRHLPHTPDYIALLPPGRVLAEKMFEMGIDAAELAKRMKVSVKTVEQLVNVEIPLTPTLAAKIEKATMMYADHLLRLETRYREKLVYAMEHPEIPAYCGTEIVNQPKNRKGKSDVHNLNTSIKTKPKRKIRLRHLPHTPNYIALLPPGRVLAEKMFEMGIDATELAKRMKVSVKTVEQLVNVEIPLTPTLAAKIEKATMMYADHLMRLEKGYHEDLKYAMEHPEIPAYRGTEIVNQPKQKKNKRGETDNVDP
jgi:plasmid maintenance system antidote protein VapI